MIESIKIIYYIIPIAFIIVSIPNMLRAIKSLKFNLMCFKCISFWTAIILSQDIFVAGWCSIIALVLDALTVVRL